MSVQDFFVEIGTEELPPKALKTLATAFSDNIVEELAKQNLSHGDVSWYAAPRRLAVRVNQLALQQQDKVVEKRGPALAAAPASQIIGAGGHSSTDGSRLISSRAMASHKNGKPFASVRCPVAWTTSVGKGTPPPNISTRQAMRQRHSRVMARR